MTSMLDLSKAYERVSHAGLVAAAGRHGFRLRRLKHELVRRAATALLGQVGVGGFLAGDLGRRGVRLR